MIILPHKLKNKVNSELLHDLIINIKRKKNLKDSENKLFCAFWEMTNIMRTTITSNGYNNLTNDDWYDIQVTAIIHMFSKIKLYNKKRKNVCFAFCYMILYNKMRDLVKQYSFNKFIHNGVYDITQSRKINNLSVNHRGDNFHYCSNYKPIKRFDICERNKKSTTKQ